MVSVFAKAAMNVKNPQQVVLVDVIIPVHNASLTLSVTVRSALHQRIPRHLERKLEDFSLEITVCCYDDGSTDDSWSILRDLQDSIEGLKMEDNMLQSKLLIGQGEAGVGRGAGFARNRAVDLQTRVSSSHHFLCLLDSDDTMHPHRIAEQASYMLDLSTEERGCTLLGCQFDRDPPDSTWHYSQWANSLTDEQLLLERFREVTVLQPTWFLCRKRFKALGGYVEAPPPGTVPEALAIFFREEKTGHNRLVHPIFDTFESLRLAEDLRFWHDHLIDGGMVKLLRTPKDVALVTYRHSGTSQSFRTSRKLLLQLRVLALERSIIRPNWLNDGGFIIWGAGRDGKDFFRALSNDLRGLVYCFLDVDEKKIGLGSYVNRDIGANVPIIHFSVLIVDATVREQIRAEWQRGDESVEQEGRITKSKLLNITTPPDGDTRPLKRQRQIGRPPLGCQNLDLARLRRLPVVVCVAKNRTNGVLEQNVALIARTEGLNLWHFS